MGSLVENIGMALASLRANKLRSLLTMLGIIIGIAAVIAIETVGGSLSGSVTDSMAGMGVSNITVSLTQKTDTENTADGVSLRRFMDSTPGAADRITDAMVAEFRQAFPDSIDHIELTQSVGSATFAQADDPDTTVTADVTGANTETLTALGDTAPLLAGRWLDDAGDAGRMLCVVSEKFVDEALGENVSNADALGVRVTLTLDDRPRSFYIAGVYTYVEDTYASLASSSDDAVVTTVYIPLDVAQQLAGSDTGYESLTVVAAAGVDVTDFVDTVGDYFASFYTRNDTWTVSASSVSTLIESMTEMLSAISAGTSAIAAISLLVGGIGVMNIMTVSVTERTREIGTRKALGAPASAIRMQFITESIVLCLIGGVAGVVLGVALGAGISGVIGFAARPSVAAIAVAVGFSMAIGVFFGYYPANKAARLDPIEALRYE